MSLLARERHSEWCAKDHTCRLGEHRAEPVTRTAPNVGTYTLTRIQRDGGGEYAEIRLSIRLDIGEAGPRARLAHLLRLLNLLLKHAAPQR
ncbi:hypothetical protein ACPPVO_52040 [Dactylosporangium sp. McL0621]|uniref:hypothetical protein n=1 Tax=Dactylosporangium sp. McL0621 TaxID=3415678 RepID=UPI003CF81E63